MARPMANDPPFATLNHFEGDSRTGESDFLRIGITASRDQDFFRPSASASSRLLASFRHLYLAPMRASASDAPCAHERRAWLEPDQSLPGSKCVRRAGHRLDCKTATADVGKRVAAKEHQVGVALVDPERDFSSVVRISELHTSEAVLVPLEVGECIIPMMITSNAPMVRNARARGRSRAPRPRLARGGRMPAGSSPSASLSLGRTP